MDAQQLKLSQQGLKATICTRSSQYGIIRMMMLLLSAISILAVAALVLSATIGAVSRGSAHSVVAGSSGKSSAAHMGLAAAASWQRQMAATVSAAVAAEDEEKKGTLTWPGPPDESGDTCNGGYLTATRKVFWQYNDEQGPGLADVLHSEDRIYAVFNIKLGKPWSKVPWSTANWTMTFHAAPLANFGAMSVPAYSLGVDRRLRTLIVHAPLPKQLLQQPIERSMRVTIQVQAPQQQQVHQRQYPNVPFCLYPPNAGNSYRHLVACTEIRHYAAWQVPEWVVYHMLQGFEHFYMYINDELTLVKQHLEPLVQAGLVTVVDWQWPKQFESRHWYQQAEQHSCLLRSRSRARWVGLHDVDEFFQVMEPGTKTVAEFLHRRSSQEHVAAFQANTIWFGSSKNSSLQAEYNQTGKGLTTGQYVTRSGNVIMGERQKMLVNPHSTNYMSIHYITGPGHTQLLNGTSEMRVCHYKRPHERRYFNTDKSMAAYADQVYKGIQDLFPDMP